MPERPAVANPRTLARPVLRDQLREIVLARIMDGTYLPGQKLTEASLMAEFGVSQAPVREALRELEAARFLESQPHRGVRVREVTPAELVGMYPVRTVLEELAGQLAAPVVTEETLTALDHELRAMRVAAERRDVPQQVLHDVRFHKIIVEAAGNALLTRTWATMHFEVLTMVTFRLAQPDLPAIATAHEPILTALRAKDPVRTGMELRKHFSYARMLSGLGTAEPDPSARTGESDETGTVRLRGGENDR